MRILLADDHPLFRDGVKALLAARSYEIVAEASNGREAVEKTLAFRPDLVLMDIMMPEMGGLEATRLIKAQAPSTKVIILTVSDDEQDLFEAIKSGAEGYLPKSMQSAEFYDLLDGLERGEAAISRRLAARLMAEFARPPADRPAGPEDLSEREQEVLALVARGSTNREIAEQLVITENTVKYHMKNILDKLHLRNRAQVIAFALRHGIRPEPPESS